MGSRSGGNERTRGCSRRQRVTGIEVSLLCTAVQGHYRCWLTHVSGTQQAVTPPFSSPIPRLLPRRTMRPYLLGYSVAHVGSDARSRTEPLSCVNGNVPAVLRPQEDVLLSSYHAHNRHPRRHVRSIDVVVLQHAPSDCPLSTRRAALRLAPGPVG